MTSFRLRVVVLIVFLVATSSAATAWLTLRQASKDLTASVSASQHDVALATHRLADYGHLHGGWDGVGELVTHLSTDIGQRIRVVTDSDAVLADSDLLAGRPARPVVGVASVVDARPVFDTTNGRTPYDRLLLLFGAVDSYERDQAYAACLHKAGIAAETMQGKGFPFVQPTAAAGGTDAADKAGCPFPPKAALTVAPEVGERAKKCLAAPDDKACFRQLFADAIRPAAPAQLRIYVGARDEVAHRLSTGTVALAAGLVIMVAALSALLLSRRVLRPIGALTTASRRLGAGDLGERVPVTGRDELADLARAFNRMAESLAGSEERQRRLIGDVAHELRTPLANLRGYLEALTDGVLQPSPELFASLHEEAVLQQRIVDDLQELALAEAGTLAYHMGAVDLAELVETCRTAFLGAADRAGVGLTVRAEPAAVHGDPDRLRQVISNLIRNALAATGPGGTIRIAVRALDGRAFVEVADTGRGIAATDLPHVFDRFWRADAARGRSTGGSGLGLAIAKEIVTAHGGRIAVASVVGQGTVVTADLPLLS